MKHTVSCITAVAGSVSCLLGSVASGGSPVFWATPIDGVWSDPLNWSPAVVPGASDDVILGLAGAYTVQLGGQTQQAASFTIENPQAQMHLTSGRFLRVLQAIVNDGTIVINPANAPNRPGLDLADGVTISGTGTIRLAAPNSFAELGGLLATDAAVQEAPHTIAGMGSVTIALTNRGSVIADVPGQLLRLSAGAYINEGLFAAVDGGTLRIGGTLAQSPDGSVIADGPASTIEFFGDQFSGGSLRAINGATVRLLNPAATVLDTVEISGLVLLPPGTTTTLTDVLLDTSDLLIDPPQPDPTTISFGSGTEWSAGSFELTDPSYRLQTLPGAEGVTIGGGVLLTGVGSLQLDADFGGTIRADQAAQVFLLENSDIVHHGAMLATGGAALQLLNSDIEHHGVIEAAEGGSIMIRGCTIDRMPGSVLRASGPGSTLQIESSTTGGELAALDGAALVFGRSNDRDSTLNLHEPVLVGDVTVQPRTLIQITGSLVNNGAMRMMIPSSGGDDIEMTFADGARIDGVGTIEFGRFTEISPQTSGAIVTLGAGQTIIGEGRIRTGMVVEGTVRAEPGKYLGFEGGPVTSRAEIVSNGGTLAIGADFVQSFGSRLVAENGGTIRVQGQIYGGEVEVEAGSAFEVWDAKLFDVIVNGDTTVRGGDSVEIIDGFTNNGRLLLNTTTTVGWSSVHFPRSTGINGSGTILMSADHNRTRLTGGLGAVAEIGHDQRLEGSAITEVPLVIRGVLAPGIGVGLLYTNAPLTLAPTGTLEIDISPTGSDQIVTRGVDLGGKLEIHFVDGFVPSSAYWDRVFILAAFGQQGEFDQIEGPPLADPRLEYRVTFNDPQFRVGTYCRADRNSDRQLNFFDLSEFVAAYNAAGPDADLAAPFGVFNFFDIAAYIDLYNLGCP